MGCATGMVKYLVFLFNLVFAVAGLAMLAVGILFQISLNDTSKAVDNKVLALAPTLLIIIGSIVFVISFFGCCGAIKESTCMLTTYAVILLGIFILQIAIGVYAFLQVKDNNGSFKKELFAALDKSYQRYYTDEATKEAIDVMQQALQCCGNDTPDDFRLPLPPSCCRNNKDNCDKTSEFFFDRPCKGKLYDSVKSNIETIGYVALGLCVTEIVAAVFSLCLTSSIRNERRRSGY